MAVAVNNLDCYKCTTNLTVKATDAGKANDEENNCDLRNHG